MDDIPDQMNKPEQYKTVRSLEQVCLNFIVQEFDQFYFAFTVSKSEETQRNFEFLQRRFSDQLAVALHKTQKLNDEYFGFLINKHLKFLDGKWFTRSLYLTSIDNIFCCLPNLTRICFRNCHDNILKNVAKFCPKIVEIDVANSNITDTGVKYLYENKNGTVPCPELKDICIDNSHVTDKGVECLIQSLPSLESISYPNVPLILHSIYKEVLSNFKKVQSYNLVHLDLLNLQWLADYTEVLKACLILCPKLKCLSCCITEKEQLNFFNNAHLKQLSLEVWNMGSKISLDSVIQMNGSNLTLLILLNCTISVSVLANHCPVLCYIHLEDVNFAAQNYNAQVIFPCLNECNFSCTRLTDAKEIYSLLSSSPKLTSVSFSYCMFSLELKNQILEWCKNSCLKQIEFWFSELEIVFIRDILLSCCSLKRMDLSIDVDADEIKKMLYVLSKSLPNKPFIVFDRLETFSADSFDSYSNYLKTNPAERYRSSSMYDSLFREITVEWIFKKNDKMIDSDEKILH